MEGYSAGYARRAQLGESKSNDAAAALKCAAASLSVLLDVVIVPLTNLMMVQGSWKWMIERIAFSRAS